MAIKSPNQVIIEDEKTGLVSKEYVDNEIEKSIKTPTSITDLNHPQFRKMVSTVKEKKYMKEYETMEKIASVDMENEKKIFLNNAGDTHSAHTHRAYTLSITRLERWLTSQNKAILTLSRKEADNFIYSLIENVIFTDKEGKTHRYYENIKGSPATIRRDIAVISSFYSFLERRHEDVIDRNPFLGTRARPKKEAKKEIIVPNDGEVIEIIKNAPVNKDGVLIMGTAFKVMAYRGLRVGGLNTLTLRDGKFTCQTKGKKQTGEMPNQVIKAIKKQGLGKDPFKDLKTTAIANAFRYVVGRLYKQKSIENKYSVHSLRHYYSVNQYKKNKDIYALKILLGHASISVTELYLKGLKVI